MSEFDSYAHDCDTALDRGIAISGESKVFFAKGRILWLSHCLEELVFTPKSVLDYGCGTGTATPLLIDILESQKVVGVDVSARSLEFARGTESSKTAEYRLTSEYKPSGTIDLAYSNGVVHHIPPSDHLESMQWIPKCLRPGGVFALWENNPWNPGTRYVMSRIPFDKDAILLSARSAKRLAKAAGLRVLRTDYCFVFPRPFKALRRCEPYLRRFPIGAQYQLLLRK